MKTNLRVASVSDIPPYFPGNPQQYPTLTDPALIGQPCIILSSLLTANPPYRAIAHEIQLENGECYGVLDEQIEAIE